MTEDTFASGLSLVKQLKRECEGTGEITMPKSTLMLILSAYEKAWREKQNNAYSKMEKT